jgi:hypothetical protein
MRVTHEKYKFVKDKGCPYVNFLGFIKIAGYDLSIGQ